MSKGMYIPTFIADAQFKPASVQPRLFFYNGVRDIPTPYAFHYQSGPTSYFVSFESEFPYFDHYSTSSVGQDPNTDSDSLLFFNEEPSYGFTPSNTLYSKYWNNYVSMLYKPNTRFVECSAVIPFGRYVNIRLNDIITFKGSHFHLRAINNYDLQTGECQLQLLGPIIEDVLDAAIIPIATTTSTTTTTTSSTTTTQPPPQPCRSMSNTPYTFGYHPVDPSVACNLTTNVSVFTTGNSPSVGEILYTDTTGCFEVSAGFYSNGTIYFTVDQFGEITASTNCDAPPPPPPTVFEVGDRTDTGSPTSGFACDDTADTTLFASVSSFASVGVGTVIFSDNQATLFAGGNLFFGITSTTGTPSKSIQIDNSGVVQNDAVCPPAPCQAIDNTPYTFGYDVGNSEFACNQTTNVTVFTTGNLPTVGVVLYTDTTGCTPVPQGLYSDGSIYYTVDQFGEILASTSCSAPPPPPVVYENGSRTLSGSPTSNFACNDSANITLYSNQINFNSIGAGNNTIIFTNTGGTQLQGGDLFFGITSTSGVPSKSIRVNNSGLVTDDAQCPAPTTTSTTTTTSSPFISYVVTYDEFNEGTACASLNQFTIFSQCNPITLPGIGQCFLYNTANVNDPVAPGYYSDVTTGNYYYVENNGLVEEILPCPNTTTTTQPPCFPIGVVRGNNPEAACCNGDVVTHYFNASTIEAATISYGTDPTCSTPNPFGDEYAVGNQYYVSTNGVMSGPFPCPDCP